MASTLAPVSSCTSHFSAKAAGCLPWPDCLARARRVRVLDIFKPETPDMGSTSSHSTAKALRLALISIAAGTAMAVSAVAGAWMQSQLDATLSVTAGQETSPTDQARRDAVYIRENVGMLAAKVGDLQARLFALESLSQRVAEASGVSYTDPEVQAAIEASLADTASYADVLLGSWTAESLGRELDGLERQLSAGQERLNLLDAVLTRRTGLKESLPSLQPVDHPYQSSSYGWRRHPVTGRHAMHEGLDFAAPHGTPIYAASSGVVTEARYVTGYGKMVEINHGNGLVTRYAHASSISVKLGELVAKGQQIGRVGSTGRSTGAHLHFEVRVAGHPLDPTLFIAEGQPPADELADASGPAPG